MMIECTACFLQKREEDFYKKKSGLLEKSCKSCFNKRSREWRSKNRARANEISRLTRDRMRLLNPDLLKKKDRDKNLKREYGVSSIWYDLKMEEQGGVCQICGDSPTGKHKRLFVDHDHLTGKARSLLCMLCNMAVGAVRESPELAVAVSKYIKSHKE